MTAYSPICSVIEVSNYFKFTFDATSTPSKSAVESWINLGTSIIYGAISHLYTIPVTDTNDLAILKEICIAYVRDKVNYVNGANVYTVPGVGMNVPRSIKLDSFREALNLILDGSIKLLNTPVSSVGLATDYNYTNSITCEAEKGIVQW